MAKAERAQYAANMITMVLIGLWHGAGWGFILWGGYHGLLLNLYAWTNRRKLHIPVPYLGHLVFVLAVLVGWALFLSPDLAFAENLAKNMIGLNGLGTLDELRALYTQDVLIIFLVAVSITLIGLTETANLPVIRNPGYAFMLGVLAFLSLMHIAQSTIEFVYVQF
jgi:D-alanyl-lipoteichoic acid acyltransferase DltB (MBOAT superfamily)